MKKFDGMFFATDLDGTLLKNDKTISKENIDAIEYFKSEGGIFTFVTGRLPRATQRIFDLVRPNAPCGCINGGSMFDYRTNELLWSVDISRSVLELVEYIDKNLPEMGIEVNVHDKIYFCKKSFATEKHRMNEKFPDLACHYYDVKEPIAKILFAHEDVKLMSRLIEMLDLHPKAKEFDFIRSDVEYYEILPKGINKGEAVLKIVDLLGISPERTIAVGDNDNDVSMLSASKLGIAVSNASPAAKNAANHITVSNEEHAIAKIIEDLESGKIFI
ncbi:MAG: HAD family phosphatase [Clostridia bacterium]|nr:HAD family phosphatase [Clostridia bacterium]